eukprot:1731311-Rhodomonas_salina.2
MLEGGFQDGGLEDGGGWDMHLLCASRAGSTLQRGLVKQPASFTRDRRPSGAEHGVRRVHELRNARALLVSQLERR